jgi:eukaryotic translation initiation factor 2C
MVKERLLAWKAKNTNASGEHVLLTSVLCYRDGVSESQFNICVEQEIPQIREAYRRLGGDVVQLKVTFIIVGKRHHTRFFPTNASQSYSYTKQAWDPVTRETTYHGKRTNGNLKPGLLVDSVVTNPAQYNFFLQSHVAVQGNARPAHYHVLVDEMGLGKGIPELTLILCTTFGRATKVVSYAAPAYIADRLCQRGQVYLRPWANNNMGPTWSSSDFENLNGTPFTKDQLKQWRKEKALELARNSTVWGKYQDAPGRERLNPWHKDFDKCMFWL